MNSKILSVPLLAGYQHSRLVYFSGMDAWNVLMSLFSHAQKQWRQPPVFLWIMAKHVVVYALRLPLVPPNCVTFQALDTAIGCPPKLVSWTG